MTSTKLLTPSEAAELLNIKKQTLATWRSTRRYGIPFVRVGTNVRYRERDLLRWLEERTIAPAAAEA